MTDHDTLTTLRKEIQAIDSELVNLLQQRIKVVHRIGQYKRQNNLPVRDAQREQRVIDQILSTPHEPMESDALTSLFQFIMKICRDAQHKLMGHAIPQDDKLER